MLGLILPIGLSFHTFQSLSYVIEVYRGKQKAEHHFGIYALYVMFYPQLVAGPIERPQNLLHQFYERHEFEYGRVVQGLQKMLWGLFKKILVADNCAECVNQIFKSYQIQSGSMLLLGAVFFSFQIYSDFSGYSDIAIGTAKLFGIDLLRNFAFPYFSRDIAEFWRRWHISLTTWLRDYLYIPLGGSRGTRVKVIRNTLIIFLVSGFWHGANWTFIAWGGFHVILFLPLLLFKKNRKNIVIVATERSLPNIREFFQILSTFLLVAIGWVFFRSETITQAMEYIKKIFQFNSNYFETSTFLNNGSLSKFTILFSVLSIIVLIMTEWTQRLKAHGLDISGKKGRKVANLYYIVPVNLCLSGRIICFYIFSILGHEKILNIHSVFPGNYYFPVFTYHLCHRSWIKKVGIWELKRME